MSNKKISESYTSKYTEPLYKLTLQLSTSNNYSSSVFPSHGEHKRSRTHHSFPREAGGHHCGHEIAFHMHQLKWPPHSN